MARARGSPSVPLAVEIAPSLRNVADLLPQPMDRAEISAGLYRDSWFIGAYAIAYCCLAAFLCFRSGAIFRWASAAAVVLTVITVLCDRAEKDATLPVLARLGGDYRPQIPDAERAVVTDAQNAEAQPLLDHLRHSSRAKWYSCFGVGILLSFIFWPAWDQWKNRKWHLLVGALLLFGGIAGIVGGYDSPRVISHAFTAMLAGALIGLPVLLHAPTPQDFWRRQPGV